MTAMSVGELVLKQYTGGHQLVSVHADGRQRYELRRRGTIVAVAHSVPELAATLDHLGMRTGVAAAAAGARRVPARGRTPDGRRSSFGRGRPHQSR